MAHDESPNKDFEIVSDEKLFQSLETRYTHLRRLGEGGQGTVHLVQDRYLDNKMLVFKILRPKADENWRSVFKHEFEALAGLKHPRLSEVYDFGASLDGRVFFTREYIPGEDLMSATQNMRLPDAIRLFVEICRSLKLLHGRGLVHGDLKPGNIICSSDGVAKLIDFSFVRSDNEDAKLRGTVPYMAPEVIEKKRADARADLYSLGATLFEILSGAPPFEGSVSEIVKGHLGEKRSLPVLKRLIVKQEESSTLEALQSIIGRLLSRNPNHRFPTAVEAEAALTSIFTAAVDEDRFADCAVFSESLGRDREFFKLQEALQKRFQISDLSPLVVVEGQSGTGKSALLRSIKWWAQLAHIPVLESGGSGSLLRPFADIIEQAVFFLEKDDEAIQRTKQLISALSEPQKNYAHLDVLAKSTSDLLIGIAKRSKLLLIIDGLEQASFETLAVLRVLAAAVERDVPLAVLASCEISFSWQTHLGSAETLVMPLLSFEQTSHITECFLGSADQEAVTRIFAHTGGNPLFVTTLLHDISKNPEGMTKLESLGPPKQLETYWRERLLTLNEIERCVLEAAAVLDRPASAEEITIVSGRDSISVDSALSSLTASGRLKSSASRWCAATLPLAKEILAAADWNRLIEMHRRAFSLESDEAKQLYHAAKCKDQKKIEERGTAVAISLYRLGALHAAQHLLTAMMEAVAHNEQTYLLLALELGRVLSSQGDLTAAEQCLSKPALCSDLSVKREALILLGRIYIDKESLHEAEKCLREALSLTVNPLDRARILYLLAKIAFQQHNTESCIALAEEGLKDAPNAHRVRADLLGMLAKSAVKEGRRDDALMFAKEAESDAALAGDMRAVALSIDILAWVYQKSGNLKEATLSLERAAALHFEFGDIPHLMRDKLVLGDLKLWQEEWSESLRHYEQAVRLSRSAVNPLMRINVRNNYGYALIKMGCFERAGLILEQAEAEARSLGYDEQRLWSQFHTAASASARGETEDALRFYAEARKGFISLSRYAIVCEIELETAGCLLRRGEKEDIIKARELIQLASSRNREEEGRMFEESLALHEGMLLIAEGQLDLGLKKLEALCENQTYQGAKDFAWQAHLALAKGLSVKGSVFLMRQHLREAENILESLCAGLSHEHRAAFWQDVRRSEVRTLFSEISSSNQFSSTELFDNPDKTSDTEAEALYRVLDLNKQLLSESNLNRLLEMILSSAIELTGAERGMILLPAEGSESTVLEIRAVSDGKAFGCEYADTGAPENRFSCSIAESVFLDNEPVVTVDAMQDSRFNEFMSIHELKLKSVACLPVSYRGSPLGVLYLENRLRRGRFDKRDLRVLSAFANQVAIALSQNRLINELRQRADELQTARKTLQEAYEKRLEELNQRDLNLKTARERLERLRRQIEGEGDYHGVFGTSPEMRKVFTTVERVKDLNVPVIFSGESGVGKDLLARVLHEQSNLKDKPFVTVSCGSMPDTLVESMLFGHEKGAFSGADTERQGLLSAADGGTLYLDEIGDMSPRMQTVMLRVLQDGTFSPVGSQRNLRVNVRIIASTRIPLDKLANEGGLRKDLLYRLQVVTIELPPLRKRKEDILPLAGRIVEREAVRFASIPRSFSKDAAAMLLKHNWPGNVRELEQSIRRALAIGDDSKAIRADEIFISSSEVPKPNSKPTTSKSVSEEDSKILSVLESVKWNRSKAAEILGIPRRTFYRKLDSLGVIKKRNR